MKAGDASGDVEVELVEIGVVAAPGEGFAVGGEDDACDVVGGAGGAVVAGNPLGGGKGKRAGLDGDVDFSVVELAWSVVTPAGMSRWNW